MRTFKFRVWYPKENQFFFYKIEDQHSTLGKNAWDEEYTIEQSTDVMDISGKEIYEGDIVQLSYSNGLSGIVTWGIGNGAFIVQHTENIEKGTVVKFLPLSYCNFCGKIIGNIHQLSDVVSNKSVSEVSTQQDLDLNL